MPITYRQLQALDEPFLWEMLYQALYVPPGQPPFPRALIHQPEISRYVSQWGQPPDRGFIALDGQRPIGAAWVRLLIGDQRGFGYVDDATPELSIAVLPADRGRGVGSGLLTALLDEAAHDQQAICLSVARDNPARRLYERQGFAVVAEQGDSLTMIKRFGVQAPALMQTVS